MVEKSSFGTSIIDTITENLSASIVIAATIVLTIVVGTVAGPSQILNSIITGGMWALLAVGLALVFGVMNVPHFAHGESFMVGAYVAYFVFTPIREWLMENPSPA